MAVVLSLQAGEEEWSSLNVGVLELNGSEELIALGGSWKRAIYIPFSQKLHFHDRAFDRASRLAKRPKGDRCITTISLTGGES